MRALQFTEYGSPEVLTWGDVPVPHAGPGQIRIAVRAASVSQVDWKMLSGAMSGGQPLAGTGYLGYDAAGERVDAVVDVAGKTPVEELVSLVSEPSQVLSIANFAAGQAGARMTGGGADSRPMEALAEVAELLAKNKLVIKIQTFPFDRAAEAYRISQGGHVRGKLVLIP